MPPLKLSEYSIVMGTKTHTYLNFPLIYPQLIIWIMIKIFLLFSSEIDMESSSALSKNVDKHGIEC